MSVIIRLQNLPWSANASDIREFFKGLSVPEGGVHIVGGEMGDAFIAFATDEDARIAMMKSGELLKGLQVTLHLSSRTQMQKVIETARQQVTGSQMFTAAPTPDPTPTYQPPVQSSVPTTQAQAPFNAIQNAPIMQAAPIVPQSMNPVASMATTFAPNPAIPMYRPEDVQQNAFPPSFPAQIHQQQPHFNGNQQFFPGHVPIQQNMPQDQGIAKPIQNFGQNPVGNVPQFYEPQQIPQGTTQEKQTVGAVGKSTSESTSNSPQIITVESPDEKDRRESPIRGKRRESREERRRRTRSRSRSRSRDRRRRHRTRSRSRSRDRSSRRRRSRSHDRSNNRDRRDRPRSHHRDRPDSDQSGSSNVKPRSSSTSGNSVPGMAGPPSNSTKPNVGIFTTKPEGSPRSGSSRWGPRSEGKSTERPKSNNDDPSVNYRSGQRDADRSSPQSARPPYARNGPNEEMSAAPRRETNYQSNQWRRDENTSNVIDRPSDGPHGRPRWDNSNDRSRDSGNASQWHSDNGPSKPPNFNRPDDRAPGDHPFDPMPPMGHRGMPFDPRGRARGMGPGPYDGGPGRGFARGRGRGFIRPEGPPDKKRSCSIEVLKVPPGAPYSAIRGVFEGILMRPNSIKILGDPYCNPIGVALLRFTNTRDTCEAFKRAGSYIGNSCIEINFIDDAVFDNAVDINVQREGRANRPMGAPPIQSSCLRIAGLPIGCTDQDVAQIFSEVEINDIQLEFDASGKPMGGCIVKLATPDQVRFSLNRLVNITMDKQSLDIHPCPETRYQSLLAAKKNLSRSSARNENSKPELDNRNTNSKVEPTKSSQDAALGADLLTDSVTIKHAAKNVSESEIRSFLHGLSTEKVFIKASDSDQTSQVYVTFGKIEDASQATKKSNQQIGNARVQIALISKPDVMKAMGLPFNPLELFNKSKANKSFAGSLSSGATGQEAGSSFDETSHPIKNDSNDAPSGSNGVDPSSANHRGPMQNGPPSVQSMGRGAGFSGPQNPSTRPAPVGRNIAPDNFGLPGCVVAMGNVPYTAQTEDILYFFRDFGRLTADRVIRRYDEQNRPTADACVALPSPQLAKQAVHALNGKYMYNRPINITMVE